MLLTELQQVVLDENEFVIEETSNRLQTFR